uniref:Uncharacterized protein n=1 Tax=Plectus sambesii TaxID=2011161 RepID=A0A914XIZ5_9BILA
MACAGPTTLAAAAVGCAQQPPCAIVSCYRNLLCLIYDTTALVLPGCKSPDDGALLYCVCPQIDENDTATSMASNFTNITNFANFTSQSLITSAWTPSPLPPEVFLPENESSSSTTAPSGGLGGGAIAGIVIGVLILIALLVVIAFFTVRKIRERRKNHGEYRPQWEEYQHAKDLPYLPPPAIEGLI